MKCLDRYIFTEFTKKFLLFFIIVTALLTLDDLFTNLGTFLEHRAVYGQVFRYYFWHGIILLPLILPLTFCIALLFIFYSMHKAREIVLLLSSGISFFRITRIFWLLALLFSLILLWGNFGFIPHAQKYSMICYEKILSEDEKFHELKHLSLSTPQRLWYINRYDKKTRQAFDLSIHEYDGNGNEYRRIIAKTGKFENHFWKMQNGREIFMDPSSRIVQKVDIFSERNFTTLTESSEIMEIMHMPSRSLSLTQLRQVIAFENEQKMEKNARYKLRFFDIIFHAFSCCLFTATALPLLFLNPCIVPIKNITRLVVFIVFFLCFYHTIHVFGENESIPWGLAIAIPLACALLCPLFWLRKIF
ncbi:MAG: LptF/LptG family permease [Puniceicoccales bacterium]|jgi:lipopolysaccharide export LptBFGC system permease protein LptF|nr:LptF/LptG family permease [Puniceicoccales bacterium]